jgi:UDP-3-O-[3-hydroxymyristoyl] glucosamine N-acyltransferase
MTPILLIGAGKFALEITRYIEEEARHRGLSRQVAGYVALEGEATVTSSAVTQKMPLPDVDTQVRFVLATSDPLRRSELLQKMDVTLRERFVDVIHPSCTVPPNSIGGPGVIVGPHCHIGVNARVGAFTVLNCLLSVGHHSNLGEGNFLSPGFHCGNTVTIGDGNFFGLACTVGPEIRIGSGNRFQAGALILENVDDRMIGIPTQRTKLISG